MYIYYEIYFHNKNFKLYSYYENNIDDDEYDPYEHYFIGLEKEARKYAKILGYNYNSSEWFEQSYKIFNTKYNIRKKENLKKEKSFFKKIIEMIK